MPIYAYKCESCGFAKDVLQKISDAPLEVCPSCQAASFRKQVTAAGFQLKGSGWYVTDFKGGNAPSTATAPASTEASAAPAPSTEKTDSAPAATPAATTTSTTPSSSTS